MKNNYISKIFGVLLISGIAFGILNSVPALEKPEYLALLPYLEVTVLSAVFFQAAMAAVYVLIAVVTYPMVKRVGRNLAHAYFAFRIISSAFLFAGIASLLLLLWLSQSAAGANGEMMEVYRVSGEVLRRGRDYLNHIGMILPWSIGGLILNYSFHRTKRIPRWMAIWGMGGYFLTLVSTVLYMLTLIEMAAPPYFLLNTPTAFYELFLAGYLLIKGFRLERKGVAKLYP